MTGPRFTFDRTWVFAASADDVWGLLTHTERYPRWWPWLARLDSDGLTEGAVARCVVQPPLPYRLRFDVHLDRVDRPRLLEGTVTGDLQGPARLELRPGDGSDTGPGRCTARLAWEVELGSLRLRRIARVARPVMQWGHDLVIDRGVQQFRRRALDRAP